MGPVESSQKALAVYLCNLMVEIQQWVMNPFEFRNLNDSQHSENFQLW